MRSDRVRRAIPPVVAWAAAAAVAVAVASWGVALVGRSVTADRPAPLEAAQVAERLDAAADTSSTSSTSTTSVPGPVDGSTSSVPTTTAGTPIGPSPTTTTLRPPPPSPTTTAPAPTTTAAPPPTTAAGETRTYSLVGGTASLRFSPSGVTVVFANPAQGFDVDIESEHGNGVRVRFESESHESRVTGWWQDGPQAQTEERADD